MKPGQLRRFYYDSFPLYDTRLNGKLFLVLPWQAPYKITILVEGAFESFWSQNDLIAKSELICETR